MYHINLSTTPEFTAMYRKLLLKARLKAYLIICLLLSEITTSAAVTVATLQQSCQAGHPDVRAQTVESQQQHKLYPPSP